MRKTLALKETLLHRISYFPAIEMVAKKAKPLSS